MRIDSSGYVGIGDDSPNRPLVVSSSQNIIASLESTDADVYITLSDDTSTSDSSQRIGVTGDDMHFWTDSVERMRIDSDGMVTTSGAANTNGDSRRTISIDDTTAMAAGVGGGISFGGKYKSDGTITRFAGIWGEKENGNNEDESGQLHLGTREDNGTVSSDLVIGSSGQLGIGGANYGTDGYVLTSGGASAAPSWESLTAGDTLPVEDSTSIAKDSSGSNDKEMRIDVGAITEGVTRVITMGDRDVDLASGGTFQDYDADTAKTDVTQTFTKPQRASVTTITVQNSTQYQADFSEGNNFYLSLASSVGYSLLAPTNVVAGQSGIITIKQTNGGTIAFNSIFKFEDGDTPPALSGGGTYNQLVYYVESSTHIVAKLLRNTS
jgi:hypothetical protein